MDEKKIKEKKKKNCQHEKAEAEREAATDGVKLSLFNVIEN